MAGRAATRLLEQMRRSKSGWGQDDLDKLYLGFGPERHEGSRHRVYIHPRYPAGLRAAVARHSPLAKHAN
ncbi:MAG: hypothetical protein ACR2HN_07410 [Tepidiformaceae bacterium]